MIEDILTKFVPRKDQVFLKKHKLPDRSTHGLILNIHDEDHPNFGDVIAVGSEVNDVFVGEVVVFNHYAGNRVTYQGHELFFMEEKDILATVTDFDE